MVVALVFGTGKAAGLVVAPGIPQFFLGGGRALPVAFLGPDSGAPTAIPTGLAASPTQRLKTDAASWRDLSGVVVTLSPEEACFKRIAHNQIAYPTPDDCACGLGSH